MDRSQVPDASRQRRASGTTGALKRVAPQARVPRDGMRAAYDEIIATAVQRQHEPRRVVGDLLGAEINESAPLGAIGSRTMASARSIKYQMTIAKLPLAKDIDDFDGRPEGRHRSEPDGRRDQRDAGARPRRRCSPSPSLLEVAHRAPSVRARWATANNGSPSSSSATSC